MKEKILSTLKNIEYLSDTSFIDETSYNNETYNLIFNTLMEYKEIHFKLKICIPKDWDRRLIDIYVVNFLEIPYIPHIGDKRKTMFISIRRNTYRKKFNWYINKLLTKDERNIN